MKEEIEKPLHQLYEQLEREIGEYRCLIEELKEESKTLQKNSPDSLMQAVHTIECRTTEIIKINPKPTTAGRTRPPGIWTRPGLPLFRPQAPFAI